MKTSGEKMEHGGERYLVAKMPMTSLVIRRKNWCEINVDPTKNTMNEWGFRHNPLPHRIFSSLIVTTGPMV